jgi:hypothetical protein
VRENRSLRLSESQKSTSYRALLTPQSRSLHVKRNIDRYKLIVAACARTLFDRDTAPSPRTCVEIPALIVPGRDAAHATSAARYLEQCLPRAEYWDVPVEGQTEAPTVARVIEFLAKA